MKNILLIVIFSALLTGCGNRSENASTTNYNMKETTPVLRHVVLFSFKDSSTPADIESVEAAFLALHSKIKEIKSLEWGLNNSPEGLDKGFTHCFFLTFNSEEDRAIYLPHPDHKDFGEVLSPHLKDVLVVDYWTK